MVDKELFDEWPERYDDWFTTPIGKIVKETEGELVAGLLATALGETILDAGCGTAVFTMDYLSAGARVTGLDISAPMLKFAIRKAGGYPFSAVRGDIRQLPFKDNSFDKAVSVTTLEFVAEGKESVDELFRVVRPGGRGVVATLNSLSPWAARRKAKTLKGQRHILESAYFRSPDELLALSPHEGVARTVIHFAKDETHERAVVIEQAGQARKLNTGAFVAACWKKPS